MGIAAALVFANLGVAYGTVKSGVSICSIGDLKSDKIIKSVIPVIMASILGIYGLIVVVILNQKITDKYSYKTGYSLLSSGFCYGLCSLGEGNAIGIGGDAGFRALRQTDKIFVGMMLILIFEEELGLYGLLVWLILAQ